MGDGRYMFKAVYLQVRDAHGLRLKKYFNAIVNPLKLRAKNPMATLTKIVPFDPA
jgi:hypothetical protein